MMKIFIIPKTINCLQIIINNIKIGLLKLYSLNTVGNISTNKRELQKDYFDKARRQ